MLNRLIEAALIVVLTAGAAGQLPRLVRTVRIAQLQLLKDSQSVTSHLLEPSLRGANPT
jgi:hypothetical protein